MIVSIIGAGPVGLYFSILLKLKLKHDVDITIYEKRQVEYTRDQILIVNTQLLNRFPVKLVKLVWGAGGPGCYTQLPWLTRNAFCYKKKGTDLHAGIVISSLEKIMKTYALELGIKIINEEINVSSMKKLVEISNLVIGSDGTKSVTSEYIKNDIIQYMPTTYGLGFTFSYKDNKKVNEIPTNRLGSKIPQHRYRGFRSKEGKGYLGVTLSETEYNEFVSNPSSDIIQDIISSGLSYYSFTDVYQKKIFPITVEPVKKSKYCDSNTNIFLIGDSASNTHYFTGSGVNNGFLAANFLVNSISSKGIPKTLYTRYQKYAEKITITSEKKIKEVIIDFDVIKKSCKVLTDSKLKNISIKQRINFPLKRNGNVNMSELCYLLARSRQIYKSKK